MGGIMIYDFVELQEEKAEIDIAGVFRHVLEDYFKTEPPRIFAEEPWEDITIDQKIAFENELNLSWHASPLVLYRTKSIN
jgi:hypothetical protein